MKRLFLLFITILIIISFLFYYISYKNTLPSTSSAVSGIVTDKYVNDKKYFIKFKRITDDKKLESVTICVKDEIVWNLIEVDRTYFVDYSSIEGRDSKLEYIEINDEFKKIMNDMLKEK